MSAHRRRHAGGGGGGHGEANAERWLLTYADMITLLLALFIVLFAVSTINQKKFLAFELGLTKTFNPSAVQLSGGNGLLDQASLIARPGTNPSPTPVLAGSPKPTPGADATAAKVQAALAKAKLTNVATVSVQAEGVVVQVLADRVFFSIDSANIGPLGNRVVDVIADTVRSMPNDLQVQGYTDDEPIIGGPYSSNWALSSARAANVVDRLNAVDGIAESRLSAVGFGKTHPAAPNTTAANQARNRRIDVVILNAPASSSNAG